MVGEDDFLPIVQFPSISLWFMVALSMGFLLVKVVIVITWNIRVDRLTRRLERDSVVARDGDGFISVASV
jgi:hypothetical protein